MKWCKKAFTLIEMVLVIAILGILTAIAIPILSGFVESGKQLHRSQVARTLYVAAQNQLTELRLSKNLKSSLTGKYYVQEQGVFTDVLDQTAVDKDSVFRQLGNHFPAADQDNKKYVCYISKPYGPLNAEASEDAKKLYALLDKVVADKSILHHAILMEYNIETGVLLSLFYSDSLKSGESLAYLGDSNSKTNISGERGSEDAYAFAGKRQQGFYGVDATGKVSSVTPPAAGL